MILVDPLRAKRREVEQRWRRRFKAKHGIEYWLYREVIRPTTAKRRRQHQKRRRHALKLEVFDAYGGRFCNCCFETEELFLTLDHIDGGGRADRARGLGGHDLYASLKRRDFPPGFQVLCMNCNFARGMFGRCPHERAS